MTKKSFSKILSANDVGATGGHQGGILIPKSEAALLAFLPTLESGIKNPDAWLDCVDEAGVFRKFRFVYYNNKLHVAKGTRNEYRITHMTPYFRETGAREGDTFEISRTTDGTRFHIRMIRQSADLQAAEKEGVYRIKLSSSWRQTH